MFLASITALVLAIFVSFAVLHDLKYQKYNESEWTTPTIRIMCIIFWVLFYIINHQIK
jgi:phosphatidylserine synthase